MSKLKQGIDRHHFYTFRQLQGQKVVSAMPADERILHNFILQRCGCAQHGCGNTWSAASLQICRGTWRLKLSSRSEGCVLTTLRQPRARIRQAQLSTQCLEECRGGCAPRCGASQHDRFRHLSFCLHDGKACPQQHSFRMAAKQFAKGPQQMSMSCS